MNSFDELVSHFLKDMFYAEQQVVRSLPQIASGMQDGIAREAVETMVKGARSHVEALRSVFADFGQEIQGATCEAILGLLKETEEVMAETPSSGPVRDAGLIACTLAIQHYSVARYGALLGWAKIAGRTKAAEALTNILQQAQQSAQQLLEVGSGSVARAARAGQA